VSSKTGGEGEAGTTQRTPFSAESTTSRVMSSALCSLTMSQAESTPPINLPGAYTPHYVYSSRASPSLKKWLPSLSTSTHRSHQLSSTFVTALLQPRDTQNQQETSPTLADSGLIQPSANLQTNPHPKKSNIGNQHSARTNILPPLLGTGTPARYNPNLSPIPSPLHPHCLTRDRLRLWKPAHTRLSQDQQGLSMKLGDVDLDRIADVMSQAWESSTRETYRSGLLTFHVFCDNKQISEAQCMPISHILLSAFISELAGAYSGRTIANYIYGIRAWHILHGATWELNKPEVEALREHPNLHLLPRNARNVGRSPPNTSSSYELNSTFRNPSTW
jgi:hypothetical protein